MIYWLALGKGRRYKGAVVILLAVLLLGVTTTSCLGPFDSGPGVLLAGIVSSVSLGWIGCIVQCRTPPEPPDEPVWAALVDEPVPSTQSLQPADVEGRWQFYVDAAAGTVTLDLQPNGRFEQVIVANSGDRTTGPGGQWTLDGTNLELTDYRSATRRVTIRVRWFFGDWGQNPILFAKDDPHSKTMLLARRQDIAGLAA